MKNKEKYDLNTLKVKWIPQTSEIIVKLKSDNSIIFSKKITLGETGTGAYNAWLEEEYKPQILTDKEKAYLSAVIKPFRDRVISIEKRFFSKGREYLSFKMHNWETLLFPTFCEGTMYKGMEVYRKYTLEELGL